jgi:hypothetical protein
MTVLWGKIKKLPPTPLDVGGPILVVRKVVSGGVVAAPTSMDIVYHMDLCGGRQALKSWGLGEGDWCLGLELGHLGKK